MNIIIETPRLILRPFTIDDAVAAYHMNLDPDISRYTNDGGIKTLDEIRQVIKETTLTDYQSYGYGRFAVESKSDKEYIGFAGLKYLPEFNEVDLGYRLKKEYWGKGLATEAGMASLEFGFSHLRLEKIIGLVLPDNLASCRVLTKLGFRYEKEIFEYGTTIHYYNKMND